MARATLTKTTPLGPYPSLPVAANALDMVMTAADVANLNQIVIDGPGYILVQNTGGVDYTFTLTSAPDQQLRTGDIGPYTISADELMIFKIDQTKGWVQPDGNIYLQASNAAVKIGWIRRD